MRKTITTLVLTLLLLTTMIPMSFPTTAFAADGIISSGGGTTIG